MTNRALDIPAWPQYGEAERAGPTRALEQGAGWRMGGSEVDSFEREFAALLADRRAGAGRSARRWPRSG
jgi:hypothetical protein